MTDQSLVNLANDLTARYERTFAHTTPPESPALDDAINAIYAQIPYYMKVETRQVNPFHQQNAKISIAQELLSDLPRMVLDSDLPATKKRALLSSIGDVYRLFIS